ncbi:phosphatase PAP2 family protein [Parachlamydia sp. AcF125]|uniref:phosphatase PAP2 family protein n=1 Tax=Parachlamydia sp. AcF125 TaxID=2795736 RepID=UPI001BC93949|nr:phosphatase PAP2 family protein [Parachlamydia sp. AcF125]MBS4168683.1 hypothetical protein [Parachlamydia sp. AcF125]
MHYFKRHRRWLWPLLIWLCLTPFTAHLDLAISRYFYSVKAGHFSSNLVYQWAYCYGTWPGLFLAMVALIVWALSFFTPAWKKWRSSALLLVLTCAIGSGLIVHAILKDNWGRPRPRQTTEFGGQLHFRPYYLPHFAKQAEEAKSFPSGHSSMGFYFVALIVLGSALNKKVLVYTGIVCTLILGTLLSLTRIAQGGHFFSDVLFSGLIMWWCTLSINWLLHGKNHERTY